MSDQQDPSSQPGNPEPADEATPAAPDVEGDGDPSDDEPQVTNDVDQGQLEHFVTHIKSAEQQIGENIVRALSHERTVAVLTTVVVGPGGQQVVSAALDPSLMGEVRNVLRQAKEERKEEEPCVGFHCFVTPKEDA